MRVFKVIFTVLTTIALAVLFVAAGLAVCLQPPVTHALSGMFATSGVSPFEQAQLVEMADATREYAFGNHDEVDLYQAMYQVNTEYRETLRATGAKVPADFPKLDSVTSITDLSQLKAAFAGASELYCYSDEAIAHLNDCYTLMAIGFPIVVVMAAIALVGLVFVGVTCKRRRVGGILLTAGILVIVAFIALGVWAVVDFNGFFAVLHALVFSNGTWAFPYDSLLICALPTPFWVGMGVICLVVTTVVSLISIVIGKTLVKKRGSRKKKQQSPSAASPQS